MAQNLTVKQWSNNPCDYTRLPVEKATELEQGDLVSYESNYAVPLDAVTEDATFAGICNDNSASDEDDDIVVCTGPVVAKVTVSSDTYNFGAPLKYVSGDHGTDYVFADASGNDTICWIYRDYASTVTSAYVLFDARALQKLFPLT